MEASLAASEASGTLAIGEYHPALHEAYVYIVGLGSQKLLQYQGAFSSCAIEGKRLGDVCGETLNRVITQQPVSERYLLGLAWTLRDMEDAPPA